MKLLLFRDVIRKFRNRRGVKGLRRLYSRREIDALMHRERARADRSGLRFALAVFQVSSMTLDPSVGLRRLARTLSRRARATDHVGRFDAERLCVILPETSAEGARSFAQDIRQLTTGCPAIPLGPSADEIRLEKLTVTNTADSLCCEVFSYPSEIVLDEGNSSLRRPEDRRGSPYKSVSAGWQHPGSAEYKTSAITSDVQRSEEVDSSNLDSLLIRPIPLWKRSIDVVGASVGLTIAFPLLLVTALLIKLTSPGPMLFCQRRAGLGGRAFTIYKFRTMVCNAEARKSELMKMNEQDGPAFKIKNDPRITMVGRILRKTSLDELPQLWNVLRGDMSLVGPRPLPCHEQEACERWQQRRLDVTPGLTCIWQIEGRSRVSFNEWVRMDVSYIARRSLLADLSILTRTIPAVALRKGAV